jgi:hypothetical protein
MEVFAQKERYCATCGRWQGPRVMSECGHIHALGNIPGYCQRDSARKDATGTCTGWTQWLTAKQ